MIGGTIVVVRVVVDRMLLLNCIGEESTAPVARRRRIHRLNIG
jgi:hypothetical protein